MDKALIGSSPGKGQMSKAVTRGQALEVSGRVATQIDWDAIDGDNLQQAVINLTPEEFGNRFTTFLKNGARVSIDSMKITPKPFDPVKFIGNKWSLVADEHDARCDALTEVDFSKVLFETCLKDGETSITGEEKLKRLKANGNIRLGASVFLGFWEDYQVRKEDSTLEHFYFEKGITYLDFFGDVLLGPFSLRGVLFLCRDVGGSWDWGWLGRGWGARHFSASLASQV